MLETSAVTGGEKKLVEVNERKMTDEDKKLFRRPKEAELQSWLDHTVFDAVNKKVADKRSSDKSPMGLYLEVQKQSQGHASVSWDFKTQTGEKFSGDSSTLSAQTEALNLQCVASIKWMLVSRDIKPAFLSRDEEHRDTFFPPDDVRDILKLSPESVLRLRKAVYGLVNTRRNGGTIRSDHF